jgi:hypothetical protein
LHTAAALRLSRDRRTTLVVVVALTVAVILAVSRAGFSAQPGFASGDCVVLTSTDVREANCASGHDGRVVTVLRQTYQACPPGSDEVDSAGTTASLCVDRTDAAR